METKELLNELEKLVIGMRDGDLSKIRELTEKLMMSKDTSLEDFKTLKPIYKLLGNVDLCLRLYEKLLRDELDEDITGEEL